MHEADGEGEREEGDRQVITKRTMRRGRWRKESREMSEVPLEGKASQWGQSHGGSGDEGVASSGWGQWLPHSLKCRSKGGPFPARLLVDPAETGWGTAIGVEV